MSNDLEKFLQQAAERLAKKTNPNARAAPQPAAPRPPLVRSPLERPPVAEVIEAEVIDEEVRRRMQREAGPDPLSTIDTRPQLGQIVSQSDQRMGNHVHQVFDHEITHLKAASSTLAQAGLVKQTNESTEVTFRKTAPHPFLEKIGDPETLRAVFVLGDIFRRKSF